MRAMETQQTSEEKIHLERLLSGAMIRLRTRTPFFAALALFARMEIREDVPTAATDGRDVFWNPKFLRSLPPAEVSGVLLHEVLHAALLHVVRRGERDPALWNIAADIVVNGIISAEMKRLGETSGIALPASAIRDSELEKFSVEEVYQLVQKNPLVLELAAEWRDLLEGFDGIARNRADMEAHWRAAQAQAKTLMGATGRGTLPAELARELSALSASQLDWRSHLWRFLVRTPTDFSGWDRRFIGRGLYLEALEGETIQVYVAIDTSGSIANKDLVQFLGEVQGILRSYPNIRCSLFYVDAAAYGPYTLLPETDIKSFPRPVGGGGTDFRPFFEAVNRVREEPNASGLTSDSEVFCVYLTDGMGTFPNPEPVYPTLWVASPGGIDLSEFPFGEAVRLV